MPLTGTLHIWHDDRGFGLIVPSDGGRDIFVHISAFPRDGTRPTAGERLSYELGTGRNGKPQAQKVLRLALSPSPLKIRRTPRNRKAEVNWVGLVMTVILFAAAGTFGYHWFSKRAHRFSLEAMPPVSTHPSVAKSLSGFDQCDGRIYCSQMTSCAEAKWFINNCPGTRMDGNHDGIPCEQQWCTSPFAR